MQGKKNKQKKFPKLRQSYISYELFTKALTISWIVFFPLPRSKQFFQSGRNLPMLV